MKQRKRPRHKPPTKLERDTAQYYANLSEEAAEKERELERVIAKSAAPVDVDADE